MRSKKTLRIFGYIGFGLLCLVFFLYVTFPADSVGQRVAAEVQRATGGDVQLSFESVSLYRFTGISLEGVTARVTMKDSEPLMLSVDEVFARVQILPLVLFRLSVAGGLRMGEGEIDVVVRTQKDDAGDGLGVEATISDLDLTKPLLVQRLTGLAVKGVVSGNVDLTLGIGSDHRKTGKARPTGRGSRLVPERSEGEASIQLAGGSFGPGAVRGFTIPGALGLGNLKLSLDMRRGRARIVEFEQEGGQVALDLQGSTTMRRTLASSSLNACARIKVADDELITRYPKLGTVLQLAQIQLQKDPDNFLNLRLVGTVGHPKLQKGLCRPSGGRKAKENRKD